MTDEEQKKTKRLKATFSMRLPVDLKNALQEIAMRQKRSLAAQIELALEEHVAREKKRVAK